MDTKFKAGDRVVLNGVIKEVNPIIIRWVDGMNYYSVVPDGNPDSVIHVREDEISLIDEDDLK